jgi:hypothetical protein
MYAFHFHVLADNRRCLHCGLASLPWAVTSPKSRLCLLEGAVGIPTRHILLKWMKMESGKRGRGGEFIVSARSRIRILRSAVRFYLGSSFIHGLFVLFLCWLFNDTVASGGRRFCERGEVGGMRICRGNESTRIRPVALLLCPQFQHDLTWDRTRTAAVGNRRLPSWTLKRQPPPFNEFHSFIRIHLIKWRVPPTHVTILSSDTSRPTFNAVSYEWHAKISSR